MSGARPTSGGFYKPTLAIYWSDTNEPLTHEERKALEQELVQIVSCTTRELLIEFRGRKVVVRDLKDPLAPPMPPSQNGPLIDA